MFFHMPTQTWTFLRCRPLPSRCEQGQDDLRQDAVMQQVFGMCSTLLQRNSDTRKRKLNIRRYKVKTKSGDSARRRLPAPQRNLFFFFFFFPRGRWCRSRSAAACWSGARARFPSGTSWLIPTKAPTSASDRRTGAACAAAGR